VEIRKIAVWVLGQLGNATDIEPIRARWRKETEPLPKAYFAHALALLGDAEGRMMLGQNLTASDAAVKTYAAEFAGYCGAVELRDVLVKLLDDPTLDVRVRAAQSLLMLSPAESIISDSFASTPRMFGQCRRPMLQRILPRARWGR
jgi:sialidase-1